MIYLYNNNPFDDLNYILNKSILFNKTMDVLKYTKAGIETTSFDAYVNWNAKSTFGAKTVLNTYTIAEEPQISRMLSEEERKIILENIRQNVTNLAIEHPETTFYIFFPPVSICWWDVMKNNGQTNWYIDAEQTAIEEILRHSNIKLFSFSNNFDLICDLDNYKDQAHYGEWVNSWMLEWMWNEEYLLTEDNYQEYIESIREFYNSYDYNSLRQQ